MIIDRGRVAAALPGYALGAELGSGAFGLVLAGEHRRMRRPVAIKVMRANGLDDLAVTFDSEARALGGLDHPHIVRAYDYLEVHGLCLVIMELLPGGTLTHRRATLNPQQSCAVALAVAAALDHAHTRGILHRDIKPDNILFAADGTVKVTDFGVAKIFEGSAASASGLAGTPQYMAPEQIMAGHLGPATDLYALGIVLYQLLTGYPPFNPQQPVQALWHQHLNSPPPPPAGVPDPVAQVVLRSLAKNPTDRSASAAAFAAELAQAVTDAYGPGWAGRTGLPLHLPDPGRRALHLPPPAAITPPRSGAGSESTLPTDAPSVLLSPPAPRRGLRRLLAAGAATLTLAIITTLLLVITSAHHPPATLSATPSTTPSTTPSAGPRSEPSAIDPQPLGQPFTGHTGGVWAMAFSSDGRTLATASGDRTARLWNITDPAHPQALGQPLTGHTDGVTWLAISPDGRTLATTSLDDTARLWNITDPAHPQALGQPLTGHTDDVNSVAFSPDGRTLATGATDSTARLWNITDPAHPQALGQPLGHPGGVCSVAFSPDGRTLATGATDSTARLWNITDPAHPQALGQPLTGHLDVVNSVAFSPDGRTLATASVDDTARLWNIIDPAHPEALGQPLTGHTADVWTVAFSPDGRTLATASSDKTARLWNITDPAHPQALGQPLTGHTAEVYLALFSPDGRTLATASNDKTVRLWKIR
ncbi:WD40 repeat domain-containing serine/threonine protein kinase [Parafrankia discariae]|uniref:WD40 repeat domain-containing serine/threonine protein kinase n=1 Tax=Parafrankia discariae TaxID=365528 RepID=UPI00036735E0|nr:serine/threonine-protein kinase [Parafrankia discariae]